MGDPVARRDRPSSVRIASLLGLGDPERTSEASLARQVGAGLPESSIYSLKVKLGNGSVLKIQSSFSRIWHGPFVKKDKKRTVLVGQTVVESNKVLSKDDSEKVYDLSRVLDAALCAYGDDRDRADAFLNRPHPLLEGETPLEMAQLSAAGADAVVALIGRAMAGVAI